MILLTTRTPEGCAVARDTAEEAGLEVRCSSRPEDRHMNDGECGYAPPARCGAGWGDGHGTSYGYGYRNGCGNGYGGGFGSGNRAGTGDGKGSKFLNLVWAPYVPLQIAPSLLAGSRR